jgi:WD40 repeat protein
MGHNPPSRPYQRHGNWNRRAAAASPRRNWPRVDKGREYAAQHDIGAPTDHALKERRKSQARTIGIASVIWAGSIFLSRIMGLVRVPANESLSPDNRRLLIADWDNTARVADASTGQILFKLKGHDKGVSDVRASSDGRRIVTASYDGTARLWDGRTGQPLATLPGAPNNPGIVHVSFSPDDSRVAAASQDGVIQVWDVASVKLVATLANQSGAVTDVGFSPDGSLIISGSNDGAVRLWDANTGAALLVLAARTGAVASVKFSPDGSRLVAAFSSGRARIWNLFPVTQDLVDAAKQAVSRCLDQTERVAVHLSLTPPAWCNGMAKYPYDGQDRAVHNVRLQ